MSDEMANSLPDELKAVDFFDFLNFDVVLCNKTGRYATQQRMANPPPARAPKWILLTMEDIKHVCF